MNHPTLPPSAVSQSHLSIRTLAIAIACASLNVMTCRTAAAREILVDPHHPAADDRWTGTLGRPLKSITRAAAVAQAGDIVIIRPGDYHEADIEVTHTGTPAHPIVFQAEQPGTVHLIGGPPVKTYTNDENPILFGDRDRRPENHELWGGAEYITVRGIDFDNARGVAIAAGTGWRIEDCRVRWAMFDGIVARGDNIAILRTVVEDTGNNGMTGGFGKNIFIRDSIIRRCNRMGNAPGDTSGASKFLWTTGLRVEGLASYDNFGSGWWMDWNNIDYAVTGCTIFGNHAGEAMQHGERVQQDWAGAGIWSEGNQGPGLIAGNLIYSNVGSGIGVLESPNVIVENNDIFDCGRGIELRDCQREGNAAEKERVRRIDNVTIRNNRIKAWRDDAAIATSVGQWARGRLPADYHVTFDRNAFDPLPNASVLFWLKPRSITTTQSLAMMGESNHLQLLSMPMTPLATHSTLLAESTQPISQRFRQIDSDEAEKMAIMDAVKGRSVGDVIQIAAFRRDAIANATTGGTHCTVYDLAACTPLGMQFNSDAARQSLSSSLTSHTSLTPVILKVKLLSTRPYDLQAELIDLISN